MSSLSDYVNQILSNYNIAHSDDDVVDDVVEYLIEIVKDLNYDGNENSSKQEIIQHILQFLPCLKDDDVAVLDTIIAFLKANSKSDHKLEQANISQTKSLIDKLSLNDDENGNGHDNIFENRKDDNENSNENENEDEDEDNIENKRYNEDMDFLLGMVPDFDQDLVQFIYEIKCNGIKDDAARYILEHCLDTSNDDVSIIKFEKAQYDTKRRAEQQQEKEEERKLQKNIVRRYGEKILLPKYDKYGRYNALKSKPIIMSFGNDNKKQDRVRYRENAVASTKGEKFIVEKTPEYDGGSRGKVMPKGKCGPGWI